MLCSILCRLYIIIFYIYIINFIFIVFIYYTLCKGCLEKKLQHKCLYVSCYMEGYFPNI